MKVSDSIRALLNKMDADVDFRKLQYYIRSMKKAPHGGVFHVTCPCTFLSLYECPTFYFLTPNIRIPYPIIQYKEKLDRVLSTMVIHNEDLLEFCFGIDLDGSKDPIFGDRVADKKLYTATASKVLTLKQNCNLDFCILVYEAAVGNIRFLDYFDIDENRLKEVFICFVLSLNNYRMTCLQDVYALEQLNNNRDKYDLTNVSSATFERQGFCINNTYYLYNIFFDTSIGEAGALVPQAINIFRSIKNVEIYMRCDQTLAVPASEKVCTASWDMQKWRGITLDIGNIESFICSTKETIVHYDPESMNKLLILVKPESTNGVKFYQITVEELWNPESANSAMNYMLTNCIHGCYYPVNQSFDHVDFSVNQYNLPLYSKKYQDAVATTTVPIDQYGESHYKVWCIKSPMIPKDNWAQLVICTLSEPFRRLFAEAIGRAS